MLRYRYILFAIINDSFDFTAEMQTYLIADLCKLNQFLVDTACSIPPSLIPIYIRLDHPVSA